MAGGQAQRHREGAQRLGGIARPAATGARSTKRVAWRRCWMALSRLARPSRAPRRGGRRGRRRSGRRLGLPPTPRCADGASRPLIWRATITRSTRACVLGARPNCMARGPVTPKHPEALPAFQAPGQEPRQRARPSEHARPGRVCSPGESRGGADGAAPPADGRGVQPVGLVQPPVAWLDSDGAVAPPTGERFGLEWPSLNAERFQLFVAALAGPDSCKLLRWDNRGAHTAQRLQRPAKVRAVWLPPLRAGAEPHGAGLACPEGGPGLAAVPRS